MKTVLIVLALALPILAAGQAARPPLPIEYQNSAEFGWLNKKVLESRLLDGMTDPATWQFRGLGEAAFPQETALSGMRYARVRVEVNPPEADRPKPNGLPSVSLKRPFPGEDWSAYNRLSFWIR